MTGTTSGTDPLAVADPLSAALATVRETAEDRLAGPIPFEGPPVAADTASARLHARLRAAILTGEVEAGAPLPSERRLQEAFGVSRHVVREALRRLEQAGLVSISHGGATRVMDWRRHGGLDVLLDLGAEGEAPAELRVPQATMEMRAAIGSDAARLCARRAGRSLRTRIRALADAVAEAPTAAARGTLYDRLWDAIVEGSDNIAYRLALTTLVARQSIASVAPDAVAYELADVVGVRALAQAIDAGDEETAHARARDLLERSIPEA